MIEFLSTEPGIVACRLSDRALPEDTDKLTHELELAFEHDGTVNLYYEIDEKLGLSVNSVVHGLRNALDMFAHRDQLGRVAIVSDSAIMRGLSKAESALLPGLTYHVFSLDDRETARAWVEGRGAIPGSPVIV